MANLNIRISEDHLNQIKTKAQNKNMTVTDYILNSCGITSASNQLTLQHVISQVNALPSGNEFSLRGLYPYNTWKNIIKTSKLSVGRLFYTAVTNKNFNLDNIVEFLGKDSSNIAFYRKK